MISFFYIYGKFELFFLNYQWKFGLCNIKTDIAQEKNIIKIFQNSDFFFIMGMFKHQVAEFVLFSKST